MFVKAFCYNLQLFILFFSVAKLSVKIEAVKKNNNTGRNAKRVILSLQFTIF